MARQAGRHFLQIPGPTNVPDRVLRAMDFPTMDHRSAAFAELGRKAISGMKRICKTEAGEVIIYPGSGTGAWEAALVNTLSPGDQVLMYETGHFSFLWEKIAQKLGLKPILAASDWRRGVDPGKIEAALRANPDIRAVCVVQNETSTGCMTIIPEIRAAIDAAGSSALLMVDTISALASIDMQMDAWNVDVIVAGSQKGLMLPPGLSFNAVSSKALEASKTGGMARSYWDWSEMLGPNAKGFFPYTPATNLLYGLVEAIDMLEEEGLDNVFARHDRHAAATRAAVEAWGLGVFCQEPRHYSSALTAILMPEAKGADALRATISAQFDMSLGAGLSKVAGKIFRIGHLGDFNDLMLMGTLCGVEMGLDLAGVAHQKGGAQTAMDYLVKSAAKRGAEQIAAE